jgi:hypothetical protein
VTDLSHQPTERNRGPDEYENCTETDGTELERGDSDERGLHATADEAQARFEVVFHTG